MMARWLTNLDAKIASKNTALRELEMFNGSYGVAGAFHAGLDGFAGGCWDHYELWIMLGSFPHLRGIPKIGLPPVIIRFERWDFPLQTNHFWGNPMTMETPISLRWKHQTGSLPIPAIVPYLIDRRKGWRSPALSALKKGPVEPRAGRGFRG